MEIPLFESLNGRQFPAGTPLFTSANRSFRYGDGIFETIRIHKGKPLFWTDHEQRLNSGIGVLFPDAQVARLNDEIEAIATLNGVTTGRARLTIFRNDGGYYAPGTDETSWHLSVVPLSGDFGSSNPSGLAVDYFTGSFKHLDLFANLKTCNALLYVVAGMEARRLGKDELIICNSKGSPIEFISGNLFLWQNNIAITPSLLEGCIDGIMRRHVLELLRENGFTVKEQSITNESIASADEVWNTNVIRGVDWVGKLGETTYSGSMAKQVNGWLNEKWLR